MFNTQGMFWNDWLSIRLNEGEEKKSSRWQYCTVWMQLESTAHALIFPLPWLPFISHSSFCLWLNPFCSNHNFQRDQQLATEIKLMKGFQPLFLPAFLPPEIFSEVSLYCCFPSDLHIAMQCIGCTIAAPPLEFIDFPANHQVSLGVAYPHIIPVLQCN